jgi:hypothetical protein
MIRFADTNNRRRWYLLDYPITRIWNQPFSSNRLTPIGNKMGILYPSIRIIKEVYGTFSIFKIWNLQRPIARWGRAKMAIAGIVRPIAWQKWRRKSVRNVAGKMIHFADTNNRGRWYLLDYPITRIWNQLFSSNRLTPIGNKMEILYPGISITM